MNKYNEADFKRKLSALITPYCYRQANSDMRRGGVPDWWLSGTQSDLWIEIKYDDKTKGPIKPKLSPLQLNWLDNRYDEGRKVCVVVGVSMNEALLCTTKHAWGFHSSRNDLLPIKTIAQYILETVNGK